MKGLSHTYTCFHSPPNPSSHPGRHITLFRVSCPIQEVLVAQSLIESDSLQPYGLEPARLLCPWDSPGKDTGVSCHFLFQGIFPTQGSNPWFESTSPVTPALADRFFTNKPPGKPSGPCWLPLKMMTFENNFDIIHSQLSSTGPQSVSHSVVSQILKWVAISFSR